MDRINITKTSWGIVILYRISEKDDFEENAYNMFQVRDNVLFNIHQKIDNLSFKYLKYGVESILNFIHTDKQVCFFINIEYNICHYQPEGMYYMFRKWFFETHDMEMPPINVYYDKETNRYIFPDLKNELNGLEGMK